MDPYDPKEFAGIAERLVQLATRWLDVDRDDPQSTGLRPADVVARFDEPLPRTGRDAAEVLERVERDYVAEAQRLNHPRYIGHQVAPPIPAAAAADVLASTMNNGMAIWSMSPTATVVESRVLSWFAGELGWPDRDDARDWGGTFVSGGAVGNLTALAAARARVWPDAWVDGVGARRGAIVTSGSAHYCIERAAGLLGLGSRAVVPVPTEDGRAVPAEADRALRAARDEGRDVLALVGTAGATPDGAVDDLEALADVAAEHGVWFHVDAAHAGAFLLSKRLAPRLAGIGRADSVAIDLHKMMFQPISTAMVLCRRRASLLTAFAQSAPYLFHGGERGALDSGGLSLQCSRRADALRAWLTLQLYGADGVAELQERTVDTACASAALIAERPEFEVLHEPQTNILCFRHVPRRLAGDDAALDRHNDAVREALHRDRFAYLTGTSWNGRRVLRMTFINPATRVEDVGDVLDRIEASAT
ncbi:MAG: pyridoxal-dependent decarboxylase [Planctomycetota bacterium]